VVIGTTAGDGWHAAWSVMWRPRGKSLQCELRGGSAEQLRPCSARSKNHYWQAEAIRNRAQLMSSSSCLGARRFA